MTYCNEAISKENGTLDDNAMMTLNKRHLQLFIKRLRKKQGNTPKIIYYAVGEYGTKRKRPHYHAIIFNVELSNLITDPTEYKKHVYHNTGLDGKTQFVCKYWPHGNISIGRVEPASIGYCLVYISERTRIPAFKGDERKPEFSIMSKGIAVDYVDDMWHYHQQDWKRQFCTLPDGKKVSMPRYIKDRIYTIDEKEWYAEQIRIKQLEEHVYKTDEHHKKERILRDGARIAFGKTHNGRRKQSNHE